LRQVNPNLENTTFDAFFVSDSCKFPYAQGLSHVSSFGFGGTNGHIVFWGESLAGLPSVNEQIIQKLAQMPPPEVRAVGNNPADWEADIPDFDALPNDKYLITFRGDDPPDLPVRWIKQESMDIADDDAFFTITGNFNAWESDRMSPGNVPNSHVATVTVPDNGALEFRFLQDDEADQVVCPSVPRCTRMSETIIGPKADLTNTWVINATPGQEFQVELLVMKDKRGVVWFKV